MVTATIIPIETSLAFLISCSSNAWVIWMGSATRVQESNMHKGNRKVSSKYSTGRKDSDVTNRPIPSTARIVQYDDYR